MDGTEIVLPLEPLPATIRNPRNMIIFSKPKVGKTQLAAGLDKSLILDLESGADFIAARKIKAKTIQEIKAIGDAIKEAGYPYEYVFIDTITALEDICIDYGEMLYAKSPQGKSWFESTSGPSGKEKYGNILGMPEGAGYRWHRQAYEKAIEFIQTWAPNIIQLGHVKDIKLDKMGAEFNALDLDLTGKLKRIACSKSDTIGYLYRKGNKNLISFITSDEVLCGARPPHLGGTEFVLSEKNSDGTFTFHWDKIYLKN